MSAIWAIAVNTFREAVRNRLLYALLGLALAMIVAGVFMGRLSLGENSRLIVDFGLFFLSLFGTIIAIFVGVNLLHTEIQRRTIYVLLATPLSRVQFLLGKYLGMLLTLAVQVVLMSAVIMLLLFMERLAISQTLLQAIALVFVELMVVTSIAVFFSSFSSPYLSGMFTFGLFALGRLHGQLQHFLPKMEPAALRSFVHGCTKLLPELHRFDLTSHVIYGEPLSTAALLSEMAYGLTYLALVLMLAIVIFVRRDFL